MVRLGIYWLGWVLLGGCGILGGEGAQEADETLIVVETGEASYSLGMVSQIGIALSNRTNEAVYYDTCGPLSLEEVKNSTVERTWRLTFLRCQNVIRLGPSQSDSLSIGTDILQSRMDGAVLDQTVRYRFLVPPLHEDERLTTPLDVENQRSNLFTLFP